MKKKIKKQSKPMPEYDPVRQQNVLLEKIGSDVKTIAEGHSGIVRRLDNLESEVDSIKSAVMESSAKIDTLTDKVTRVEKKLDTVTTDHEQRLQKIEAAQ